MQTIQTANQYTWLEQILLTVLVLSNVRITVPELRCEHEEADNRIIFHLHYLVTKGHDVNTIVVAIEDTDVIVSLLYHYGETRSNLGLKHSWSNIWSGTKRKIHPIPSIVYDIGHGTVKHMPAAHARTGADTTSKVGTKDSSNRKELGLSNYLNVLDCQS